MGCVNEAKSILLCLLRTGNHFGGIPGRSFLRGGVLLLRCVSRVYDPHARGETMNDGIRYVSVDLDGTLAMHGKDFPASPPWKIGQPVPLMVQRVKALLAKGIKVKIFTARVAWITGE